MYDSNDQASVHIIDFGKTIPVPSGVTLNHKDEWKEGNHEDGYLFGLDNLIEIWETLWTILPLSLFSLSLYSFV